MIFYSNLLVIYAHILHLCLWCVGIQKASLTSFALVSSTLLWTIPHLFHIFCLSILVDYLETLLKVPKMNNDVAYFMPSIHYCLQLQQACHLSHYTFKKINPKALFNNPRLVMILDVLYLGILMGPNFTYMGLLRDQHDVCTWNPYTMRIQSFSISSTCQICFWRSFFVKKVIHWKCLDF